MSHYKAFLLEKELARILYVLELNTNFVWLSSGLPLGLRLRFGQASSITEAYSEKLYLIL